MKSDFWFIATCVFVALATICAVIFGITNIKELPKPDNLMGKLENEK